MPSKRSAEDCIASGIDGFDQLIEGGFEKNSVILVTGDAGSGKTTFALQFLYNGIINYNEPGLFITFEESKDMLYKHTLRYGWDFKKLEKEKKFATLTYAPYDVAKLIESGGGTLLDTIESLGAKRIAIDSVTSYSLLFESQFQQREAVLKLFKLLRQTNCTSMLVSEAPVDLDQRETKSGEFLADAVVVLYHIRKHHGTARIRALEVLKMRGIQGTEQICPFEFTEKGIVVYPDAEVFEKI